MKGSLFTITFLLFLAGVPSIRPAPATSDQIHFTDVTAAAGIKFVHNSGRAGKKWLPETMGSGCAFFDADGDGWLDILLINGKDWTPRGHHTTAALYRNNHDGTFTDITRDSGIQNSNFASSAAWLDYDRDGKLDLFVANYVQWTPQNDLYCSLDGSTKSYCTPESYQGTSSKLYHNLGGGKFEDVTSKAGLGDPTSKSLGVAVLDYNNDGWPDLFVSNDTQPNKLYRNLQNGQFHEEGLPSGVAFGEDGVARGAMGVDAADYDRSGRQHLIVGNFSNQMLGLYHNEGRGLFVDEAPRSSIGRASLLSLTFGLFFFDYDLDGYPDLLAANGHIEEEIGRIQPKIQYEEIPLLFHNSGGGKFQPMPMFSKPLVARGAAYGDFDHDGDLDILVATNNGPAYLYRNDGGNKNHWLQIRLNGTKSNRDGIGAIVRAGNQMQMVHSGSSYCSSSDLALTFGLGNDTTTSIDIQWPSGIHQKMSNIKADQSLTVKEQ